MTTTQEYLTNSLKSLGNTADEVAETLGELGITGSHSSLSCPIARFVEAHQEVTLAASSSTQTYATAGADEGYLLYHPDPVEAFIRDFDQGGYSFLEQDV